MKVGDNIYVAGYIESDGQGWNFDSIVPVKKVTDNPILLITAIKAQVLVDNGLEVKDENKVFLSTIVNLNNL